MADAAFCQRCGAGVGPDGAQGLCPACLLEQGLRDSQAATKPDGAEKTAAPDLAKLVSQFPQLEIVELVGRGGMGVVYKARHRGLDRFVALKILPTGLDNDPGFQERFVREARALARLNHPNIVSVYDFGQVDGRYYFLMEFVDGANLRRMLQAGHLTPAEAMAIVPQLCDALQFAHEEGIVHRDIKPENILLDRKGRVKIADFGLAKLVGGSLPQDPYTLTSARQVLGTPHYMAPEQLERPGTVDHRADIYSLGVVFYEMLTGELPLGRFPPPSRKVQLDVRLDEVVLRTLEKEPEHRYQRAGEVKTELASLTTVPPVGPAGWSAGDIEHKGPPAPPPALRRSVSPSAVAGLIAAFPFPLACAAAAICAANMGGPPPQETAGLIVSVLAVLAVASAVTSCALGLSAIRQICAAGGRYYGLKLAFADAVAYPLLLLDLVFFFIVMTLLAPSNGEQADRIAMVTLAITLALDVWLVRRIWRRVSRAPGAATDGPEPVRRPPRPVHPSNRDYTLPPRRRFVGVPIIAGIGMALVLIAFVFALAMVRRERAMAMEQRAIAMADRAEAMQARSTGSTGSLQARSGQAIIRPEGPDGVGWNADGHSFRFEIRSPADTKTTIWAELWKDGKLESVPGFDVIQWVIPPAGQPFDGTASFSMAPGQGKVMTGWRISGNAGDIVAEEPIRDPFTGMKVRDSTWGRWPGYRSGLTALPVLPGRPLQLLVLRGGRERLVGAADDESSNRHGDVEVRLFARCDPLTPDEQRNRPMIGSSHEPPNRERSGTSGTEPANPPTALPRPPDILPADGKAPVDFVAPSVLPPQAFPPPTGTVPANGLAPANAVAPAALPPAGVLPTTDPFIRPPHLDEPGSWAPDRAIGGRP